MANQNELLSSSFHHLRFALALPVFSLLFAALCIGSALPGMIRVSRAAAPFRTLANGVVLSNDSDAVVRYYAHSGSIGRFALPTPLHSIALLNLPSMLAEIAISLPTSWPESWHPDFPFPFDLWFWRALTWPLFTLPLWWLAGRAIDALRALQRACINPRIRVAEAITMAIIGAFSCLLGFVLLSNPGPNSLPDGTRWGIVPAFIWLALASLPWIAWRRQRRIKTTPLV